MVLAKFKMEVYRHTSWLLFADILAQQCSIREDVDERAEFLNQQIEELENRYEEFCDKQCESIADIKAKYESSANLQKDRIKDLEDSAKASSEYYAKVVKSHEDFAKLIEGRFQIMSVQIKENSEALAGFRQLAEGRLEFTESQLNAMASCLKESPDYVKARCEPINVPGMSNKEYISAWMDNKNLRDAEDMKRAFQQSSAREWPRNMPPPQSAWAGTGPGRRGNSPPSGVFTSPYPSTYSSSTSQSSTKDRERLTVNFMATCPKLVSAVRGDMTDIVTICKFIYMVRNFVTNNGQNPIWHLLIEQTVIDKLIPFLPHGTATSLASLQDIERRSVSS